MSRWYAAHILMRVKPKRRAAGRIPVWENVVLIRADSDESAYAKAQARGKRDEGDDGGTFRWDGEPAEWVFAGIRKLTLCEDADKRPADGCEITYLEMEVDSERALADLLIGKPATVRLTDFAAAVQAQPASMKQTA